MEGSIKIAVEQELVADAEHEHRLEMIRRFNTDPDKLRDVIKPLFFFMLATGMTKIVLVRDGNKIASEVS
jgi:hypothetical protein